jgi:hexosaminidase
MKASLILFLFVLVVIRGVGQPYNQGRESVLHIVPEPVSLQIEAGHFILNDKTALVVADKKALDVAELFRHLCRESTGFALPVRERVEDRVDNTIILQLNSQVNPQLDSAGYQLEVTPQSIRIEANEARGLFYGVQTLMQLLPSSVENRRVVSDDLWEVPCVKIIDYPRFGWRGLMLDVSRHFFSKAFVKKYIDEMARYKFNVFHWHLSDDQGWRIQIKGLPELTEAGAWRVPRMGKWWSFLPPQPGEKATQGGYYTQEDIKEIVAYAQQRFITIVPEIDLPAHSLALITSYPNLSCTQKQFHVNPGSKFSDTDDNVVCVANDSTWQIIDVIFTQVAQLFPGSYIHVGGDEANRDFWKDCPRDQALMKKEGITSLEGLQSYFEKKLEKIIISKGKKMIGWDEILEGGIAPEATVMSWRGSEGGIKAAGMGHHVIMTPSDYCYLDLYQGDPLIEPETYSRLRLKTVYSFEPVPDGVDPQYILGGQGNLWTESVPNERQAEYMTWPRALALSEVLWSPKDKKNWPDFVRRTEVQFHYLKAAHVNYALSLYDPIISAVATPDSILKVKLATEIPGLDIYYRFDETNPDQFSPKYQGTPLDIPPGASQIKVVTYRDGKPIGHQINCPLVELKNRIETQ